MHEQHEPQNITPIKTWQVLGAMFWTHAPMVHVPPSMPNPTYNTIHPSLHLFPHLHYCCVFFSKFKFATIIFITRVSHYNKNKDRQGKVNKKGSLPKIQLKNGAIFDRRQESRQNILK
jgi:hypothetical protein